MKGKQRLEFIYNEGIRYGAIGYYKTVDEGFDAFKSFKPYRSLKIGQGGISSLNDFKAFSLGFNKVKKLYNRIDKLRYSANIESNRVLKEVGFEFIKVSGAKTVAELIAMEGGS